MKQSLLITDKAQIGNEILAYLVDHPKVQDTLEGIVEWWLFERTIRFQQTQVKKALDGLVAKGLVVEHKGIDSQTRYQINQKKYKEIKNIVKTMS